MEILRVFTQSDCSIYGAVEFKEFAVDIRDRDGHVKFHRDAVLAPAHWSETAIDILARKYLRKSGVSKDLKRVAEDGVPTWLQKRVPVDDTSEIEGAETDARQVFERLAGFWTYWGWKLSYFDSEADARAFHDELAYMLANQMFSPNSPQWFNAGLDWAYGIKSSGEGYFAVDQATGRAFEPKTAYDRAFVHSCFIQSVDDDLVRPGGITSVIHDEAKIGKYGSGTGANFSAIRGEGEPLSSGGTASGLLAALKASDRAAGMITSKGSTRQPSKMVLVDADHPDVIDYIEWKVKEEQKVAALVTGSRVANTHLKAIHLATPSALETAGLDGYSESSRSSDRDPAYLVRLYPKLRHAVRDANKAGVPMGAISATIQRSADGRSWHDNEIYSPDWDGSAYETVSGQKSNNSIRVTKSLMDAVEDDGDWDLIGRTTGKPVKTLPARGLLGKMAHAAWSSADPGIQFDTTINDWHTSPDSGRIEGSNSCSEYMFLNDTATTLAALNLCAFSPEPGQFDVECFSHAVSLVTIMMDISVSAALYPSRTIAERTDAFRPLGIGFSNLGGFLMAAGLPYDSDVGREFCGAVSALLTGLCYKTSAELAGCVGPFRGFEANREAMLRVMRNHRRAAHGRKEGYEGLAVPPVPLQDRFSQHTHVIHAARDIWDAVLASGAKHGFRNAQASVVAPTGTTSFIMDCDTMGIEPDFALVKYKTLAGGGLFKIINRCVPAALKSLGYDEGRIRAITEYAVGQRSLENTPNINHASLRERGFCDLLIDQIETALSSTIDIEHAVSPHTLDRELLKTRLGFEPDYDSKFGDVSLLRWLGFTADEILEANNVCFGHETVEGAPGLNPRDLAVFDCSVRCGRHGARALTPLSHLKMMAAAQPFISGAISKTVNMPSDSTVGSCADVFRIAHSLGLKAVALYRDGSKLSQPMMSSAGVFGDDLIEASAETGNQTHGDLFRRGEAQRIVAGWLAEMADLRPIQASANDGVVETPGVRQLKPIDDIVGGMAGGSSTADGYKGDLLNLLMSTVMLGLENGVEPEKFQDLLSQLDGASTPQPRQRPDCEEVEGDQIVQPISIVR